MNTYVQRIDLLRARMSAANISATIIPQTDPHQSEYIASHWQARRWFSGFTGSAGSLVVTATDAALWVDSRYFLQAEQQLQGSGINFMKIGIDDTPTIEDYLCSHLKPGDTVGIDGFLFSLNEYDALKARLKTRGININTSFDPTEQIWADRPTLPACPIIIHDTEYAGISAREKIEKIRHFMAENNADATFISALDEIAWILNIRSRDVRCNPVVTSYLYITRNSTCLFANPDKVTPEVERYFKDNHIEVHPYDSLTDFLSHVTAPHVIVDPATTSARVLETLGVRALALPTPVKLDKSIKNSTQVEGVRNAMVRDGVALVKAFMDMEKRIDADISTTEMDVAAILLHYRSEQDLFFDESFETIAGYGPHGAIVHYSATPETNIAIGRDNLLLVDSGAQYLDGTTDITRTVIFGEPTEVQRRDFTLVLQGNIDLAMAIFPTGTRGTQLDVLAHRPLWQHGLNYLHGTGHGVGYFLNVHEGPHAIRMNDIPTPLQPGMLVTDEPGLYLADRYGIRCENTLLVTNAMTTEMGHFLSFEAVTQFPFDRKLIDKNMLSPCQIEWLNNYHRNVYTKLSPHLNTNERQWLAEATKEI